MKGLECKEVAEQWEKQCGKTSWSKNLREFGRLGGRIVWHGGYPRNKSATPPDFVLIMPGGKEYKGTRLGDIKGAIKELSHDPLIMNNLLTNSLKDFTGDLKIRE